MKRALEIVRDWCRGKNWLPRGAVLFFMVYVGLSLATDPMKGSIFSPIDLGIHETGHLLFAPLGQTLHIVGGTAAQLAAPVIVGGQLLMQSDFFGIAFAGVWLGVNLIDVSIYMDDARARKLPLVSVGFHKNIIHDWHYLLTKAGLLGWDRWLAWLVWATGTAFIWLSVAFGAWICWTMANLPEKAE